MEAMDPAAAMSPKSDFSHFDKVTFVMRIRDYRLLVRRAASDYIVRMFRPFASTKFTVPRA
jgi:hypothetical protein